jgi:hypothetical protein
MRVGGAEGVREGSQKLGSLARRDASASRSKVSSAARSAAVVSSSSRGSVDDEFLTEDELLLLFV